MVKIANLNSMVTYLRKIIKISPIIFSLSCDLLSAVNKVNVVSASGEILSLRNIPFLFKNQTKAKAPLRLLPSTNGWSLTKKYNK